jgi:hypothetical protein
MKILQLPPYETLHEVFELDEESPSGLRWKKSLCTRIKPGDVAGTKSDKGYWNVYFVSARYKVHRIIFYMKTGIDPGNKLIDHKDGDTSLNKNLRLATNSQNSTNRGKSLYRSSVTHSAFKGVTWHKQHKKWLAQITVNRKKFHLGYFSDEVEAAAAYNAAALEHWGEFAVINNLDQEK